jgi:hypothetical protein
VTTEEYQPMSVSEFVQYIQKFKRDAANSRHVGSRWLGSILQPVLDAACEVGNNCLSEANKKAVNTFRAEEIELELTRKQHEVANLERDLKKFRAS